MNFAVKLLKAPKTWLAQHTINPLTLLLLVSVFITLSGNLTFFRRVADVYPLANHLGFLFALCIIVFGIISLLLVVLQFLMPLKWASSLLLFIAVFCAYFADNFGVVIDVEMIRNTLQTNVSEASDLLTLGLLARVFFLAVLPTYMVFMLPLRSRVKQNVWQRKLKPMLLLVAVILLLLFATIMSVSANFSSFIREHKALRYYINPIHPIYAGIRYVSSQFKVSTVHDFVEIVSYARQSEHSSLKRVVIMVVGETARSDHFGLNGYSRQTTPLLSQHTNLVNYPNISSCGTSTAISVPCMFSLSDREDFDVGQSRFTENVVDVLAKANVSVLWRDNNSDSKGVALRQQFEDFRSSDNNPICDIECRDEGLLDGLQTYIDAQANDVLIVLHQMGSHGPAYYKRYPPEFEHFTPSCQSAELSSCTQQEIINAYDNTIVYTDYFLNKIITFFQENSLKQQSTLLYVSDHGESLGEKGIYLHGLPYAFAPDAQTQVPILLWTSENSPIDVEATQSLSNAANSHDAVAPTLLQLFAVESDAPASKAPSLIKLKTPN
jgi:lipid A ethanolaminephosphotransferase